jgi:SET domain-containing protein
VDDQHVIDATFFGGKARYLNHSCQANCDAQTPVINGQNHILIFAKKNIMDGEELTYNYQFGQDEDN